MSELSLIQLLKLYQHVGSFEVTLADKWCGSTLHESSLLNLLKLHTSIAFIYALVVLFSVTAVSKRK